MQIEDSFGPPCKKENLASAGGRQNTGPPESPGGARYRIVVLEDDASLRENLEGILRERYEVEAHGDAAVALAAVHAQPPDLIMVDVATPVIEVRGFLQELRCDVRTEVVPVIVLVAGAQEESCLEGLDAGADDFVTKPFTAGELLARVGIRLGAARLRRAALDAVRASEQRFERFTEHLPGLAWIKDLQGRYVYANDAATKAFRTPREVLCGKTDPEVFPPEVAAQFQENDRSALASGTGIQVIETLEHEDGIVHHSIVSKFPIPGSKGAAALVGGMAIDITELKRAEEALRKSEQRFRQLANAMPQIVYVLSSEGEFEYLNQRWHDFTGLAGAGPSNLREVLHADDIPLLNERWSEADARGAPFEAELRFKRASDGEYRWFLTRAVPIKDGEGGATRWFGTCTDIDDRKRAEQRQSLLAKAGQVLSSSLDYELTLANVCKLAVPGFADWCALDLRDEDGQARRVGVAHADPARGELAQEFRRRHPIQPDDPCGPMQVLRTGVPEVCYDIPAEYLEKEARNPGELSLLRALGPRSLLIVPLSARGRTLGAMTLVREQGLPRFDEDDLQVALELGARAALAVDNARLFETGQEALRRYQDALELHCTIEKQLTSLVEASASLSVSLDIQSVSGAILALSRRLVRADACAIWRDDPATGLWGIAHCFGLSSDFQHSVTAGLEHTVRAPETPIVAEDTSDLPTLESQREAYDKEGIRAMMLLPLGGPRKGSGTLVLYYRSPQRFTEVELRVATALSNLAAAALRSADLYEQLRSDDRRKEEFLAMLAHELRNPLAAIDNAAALVSHSNTTLEQRDWGMDVIVRQVQHLIRMIDDLLDVSRITRGKIQLRTERIDARSVLKSAIETARPLVEERRHRISTSFGDELSLHADPARLEQIAVNLITNAAKYTEVGGEIWLVAQREDADLVIKVRDTGIGIPADQLPKIFELFAQGDRSLARSEGGLGIGLTLVRKLTEMHGGKVTASSDGPGRGSEFIVRLPAATKAPDPPVSTRARFPGSPRAGARILIVDDNVDMARGLAKLLERYGHAVQVVYDGPSGIAAAREARPDYVLLDIGLPGMDGYEVAAHLRQEEGCKSAVIIGISGYGREEDYARSHQAGFHHHLIKPVKLEEILEILAR
jgi:PAS domain S-box-containing protein